MTDMPLKVDPPMTQFSRGQLPHVLGCACCLPRSGAATALAALFRSRAVNGAEYRSVLAVVTSDGEAAIRAALTSDILAAARFRLADEPASGHVGTSASPLPSDRCM